ncbi:37S ribosomal protein S24, mitochondrial [Cladochytrium tenue]|nr:37S ribosomal protein S24, mitochondrial [Cladochytrium tenue]
MHRFDLDFFETAHWVKGLLLRMKEDQVPTVVNTFDVTRPRPAAFRSARTFAYDFSRPAPPPSRLSLLARAADLVPPAAPASGKQQNGGRLHKLLLLAGRRYDPFTGVLTLRLADDWAPHVLDGVPAGSAREKAALAGKLKALVDEAKAGDDSFADVPLDLRHAAASPAARRGRGRPALLEFPREWLRPAAAAKTGGSATSQDVATAKSGVAAAIASKRDRATTAAA